MRSTAAAALLSVCGFFAPVGENSELDRFDYLNVRGASADVPTEKKSAFGAEMGDVAVLLKKCGKCSLVFVDELGRGTSPRDGIGLAAAILEDMLLHGMTGVFATHLHDVLDLQLEGRERLSKKQMAFESVDDMLLDSPWTYKLNDGVCRDSRALHTANYFGVPKRVIERAEILRDSLDSVPNGPQESKSYNGSSQLSDYDRVKAIAETVLERSGVVINFEDSSPPALESRSIVYILIIPQENGLHEFYVGETDKFNQRLKTHRTKYSSRLSAIAFPVDDKSAAQTFETILIRKLMEKAIPLRSASDGRKSIINRIS